MEFEQRGLADAGAAGHDRRLGAQNHFDRGALRRGERLSTGRAQWPSPVAPCKAKEIPARTRCGATRAPSFMAIAAAVRKPMPRGRNR